MTIEKKKWEGGEEKCECESESSTFAKASVGAVPRTDKSCNKVSRFAEGGLSYITFSLMASDYSIFKYFKGEPENPFDLEKQNIAANFWFYESIFQQNYDNWESSDWYAFFGPAFRGKKFMELLTEKDYKKPLESIKGAVFDIWLDYLFTEKLYPEYGGAVNDYKEWYYSGNF